MLASFRARALSCVLVATVALPPCAAAASPVEANRLDATVSAGQVFVDFAADAEAIRQIELRRSDGSHVLITWLIDLRRVTRGWRNPRMAKSTVQVTVENAPDGLFEVHRRANGQLLEMTRMVDRDAAYDLLSSFRLPLFNAEIPDGTYEVSVRAVFNGGAAREFTTPILAKAELTFLQSR